MMAIRCLNCRSEVDPTRDQCRACGDPITHFLREHASELIDGKYRVVSRLGIGGMGEVYKVLHERLDTLRVVKFMRPALSRDQGAQERFVREARLATRIGHANVATLHDFSTMPDGCCYTVWEFIDGMTLANHMRARGPLPPRHATSLAIAILAGLEAIHRCGIVHRDISPENVMITRADDPGERVKIIDLGIAKEWADSDSDKTHTGVFIGKWKYCSPEQLGVLGPGERIDNRSDLYSFGAVMYQMLTGQPPFVADSPQRYVLLHATQQPRPLRDVAPDADIPESLERVVLHALEKVRERRFASAREIREELESIRSSFPPDPELADLDTLEAERIPTIDQPTPPQAIDAFTTAPKSAAVGASGLADTTSTITAIPTLDVGIGVETDPLPVTMRQDPNAVAAATAAAMAQVDPDKTIASREPAPTLPGEQPAIAQAQAPGTRAERLDPVEDQADAVDPRNRTLLSEPIIASQGPESTWQWRAVAAGVTIAILSVLIWLSSRSDRLADLRQPAKLPVVSEPGTPALPMAHARLSIWAYPWAQVTRITNRDTGARIETNNGMTPLVIDVPAGRYEVVLHDPALNRDLVKHVSVDVNQWHRLRVAMPSADVSDLPDFGVSQ